MKEEPVKSDPDYETYLPHSVFTVKEFTVYKGHILHYDELHYVYTQCRMERHEKAK
jgi:hypothetical protein